MLDEFKRIDVFYFAPEFESTKDLYNVSTGFVQQDLSFSAFSCSYGPKHNPSQGNIHKINDVFYHFSWFVFPRLLEEHADAIDLLIEAATVWGWNLEELSCRGNIDDIKKTSLRSRPTPIFQLFWRSTITIKSRLSLNFSQD